MPLLTKIHIENLRNLISVSAQPARHFNILYGHNGSGKTSFLEAIYYLALGRSFRTQINSRIIRHEAAQLSLFAQVCQEEQLPLGIGISRQQNGASAIRISQENASIAELTRLLPLRLLNPDSRELLIEGPKARRQFLDWGVFHVEPSFLNHWQTAQRILKQRNAAIRSGSGRAMIQIWDGELEGVANRLHEARKQYVDRLLPIFFSTLHQLIDQAFEISLTYKCGWDETLGLKAKLEFELQRDMEMGYTRYGPHKADIAIRVQGSIPAQDVLSQGQQKLLVYALHLAQGILLREQMQKHCIFLLDDLPAELDPTSRQKVAQVLNNIEAQVFVTGVERAALSDMENYADCKLFHVERGKVSEGGYIT